MTNAEKKRRQEIRAKLAHLGDRESDLIEEIAAIQNERDSLINEMNGLKYRRTND